ncbi:MAG: hypothetical protein LUI07_03455 [Lachnospiraceae bacterium]|nr:hypothetical protein [Lachnospiraceae bacterium]
MDNKAAGRDQIDLTPEQSRRLAEFFAEDDMDYYEHEIMHLPEGEQKEFFRDNPKFMQEYLVDHDAVRVDLLQDDLYRRVLRTIRQQVVSV